MNVKRPTILNESEQSIEDFSGFCPKCGSHLFQKGEMTGPDFDENGWFHVQNFQCQNPKCLHEWTNKVVIQNGGTLHKHAF
jgi:hypothetical protein